MKVLFYTKEFPPYVYGGAGVVVEYLAAELAKLTGPKNTKLGGSWEIDSL